MTTKDKHVYTFWYDKTVDCIAETHREVTVGEVARFVGQSRATSKKYLSILVGFNILTATEVTFKNGTTGKVYSLPDKAW